jgi:hypothetical protein
VPTVLDYQEQLLAALTESERHLFERLLAKLERQLDLPCQPTHPEQRPSGGAASLPEPSRTGPAP